MRNKMSINVNVMKARNFKPNIFYFLRRIPQWRRFGSGGGSMEASLVCDSPSLLGSWRAVWKSHEKNTSFLWCEVRKVFSERMNYLHRMNLEMLVWASPRPLEFFWLHFLGFLREHPGPPYRDLTKTKWAKGLAWVLAPCFWQSAWEHLFWVICSPKTQR